MGAVVSEQDGKVVFMRRIIAAIVVVLALLLSWGACACQRPNNPSHQRPPMAAKRKPLAARKPVSHPQDGYQWLHEVNGPMGDELPAKRVRFVPPAHRDEAVRMLKHVSSVPLNTASTQRLCGQVWRHDARYRPYLIRFVSGGFPTSGCKTYVVKGSVCTLYGVLSQVGTKVYLECTPAIVLLPKAPTKVFVTFVTCE